MIAAPPPLRVLGRREQRAMFWRSMLLQGAWNFEGMQNLGFLYAIEPGLARAHPDPARRRQAAFRHLGFFNTQPHMAGFALGACLAMEEGVAAAPDGPAAEAAAERLERVKRALGSALAALGDPFFWGTLKPATAAFTLLAWTLLWTLGLPAPFFWGCAAGLAVFNAPALWTRWAGPRLGYEQGEALPIELKRNRWHERARWVRLSGLAAALAVCAAAMAVPPLGGTPSLWNAAALVGAVALRAKGVPTLRTYLAAAVLLGLASAAGR